MAIYMTHETHGATHVYNDQEATALEKSGWKRDTPEEWMARMNPVVKDTPKPLGRPKGS